MFVWWGPELINIYNDAYAPMLGKRHPEALGKPARQAWAEIWPVVGPQAEAVMRRGAATWNERVRLVLERYGFAEETYFTWSYSPIHLGDRVGGVFCACVEETQREVAERQCERLAEQRQLALDAAQMGWWHYDPRTDVSTCDQRFREIFGVDEEQRPDKGMHHRLYPPDLADVVRKVKAALDPARPQPFATEFRILRKDDSMRWVEAHGIASFEGEGEHRRPISFVGTVADITARKDAEAALVAAEERWQLAVRGSNDGIWDWNTVNDWLYWSPRCKQMLGYSDDELVIIREKVRELIHPEDREAAWAKTQRYLTGQTPYFELEYRLRHKDGSYRWILARGVAVRDSAGNPIRMAGSHTDITDRREMEESLRRSQSRLQLAVDALGLGLWSLNLGDQTVEESEHLAVMLGLPPGVRHETAEDWRKYVHPDDLERVTQKMQGALAGVCEYDDEHRLLGADGVTRWVHVKGTVIRDQNQNPIRVLGVVADLTSRKRDEEARAHLAAIVESSDDAIVSKSLDGVIRSWNAGAKRIFGYTAEEAVGRPILMLLPKERQDEEVAILARLRRGERIEHYESIRLTKDGRFIDVSLTISPVKDYTGKIIGASKVARDITDRKLAEKRLREESNIVDTVNRVGRSVAAELDLKRLVQTVVDATTELTGARRGMLFYKIADAAGEPSPTSIAFSPASADVNEQAWRDADLATPTISRGILRVEDATTEGGAAAAAPWARMSVGTDPLRSFLGVPVISRSGEVLGGLCLGHERPGMFTERHERLAAGIAAQAAVAIDNARLFEAIRRANAEKDELLESERSARGESERQSRLKDEFVSTLSHELRTPLNAILGYSQILRSDSSLTPDLQEGLAVIERNARVQAQIVEDILDVSRIVSGKMRLEMQRVNLRDVIEAALETCKPAADAKGIRIGTILDSMAGPVSGDPARLQQCVWNLVSNAIKFSPRGARVQVTLQRVDSHVEVTVSDTGQGISPDFLPFVFDRFRQADGSTTRRTAGLGLGLAIVKSLVEMHGGTIVAASEGENRGATFAISLPLPSVQVGQDRRPSDPSSPAWQPLTDRDPLLLKGVKVLVVDDESDARALVRRLLRGCGAAVVTAGSAREALVMLDTTPVDVVVSDIGMPDVDGYELVRKLRQRGAARGGNVPAIALTAYARSEDRTRAMLAGFTGHVAKPLESAELIATIASLSRK